MEDLKKLVTPDVVRKFKIQVEATHSASLEGCREAGRRWAISAIPVEELYILRDFVDTPSAWAEQIPDEYAASKLYQLLWPGGRNNIPEFWEALGISRFSQRKSRHMHAFAKGAWEVWAEVQRQIAE